MPFLFRKTVPLASSKTMSFHPTSFLALAISLELGSLAWSVPMPQSFTRGPTLGSKAPSDQAQRSRSRFIMARASSPTATGTMPAAAFSASIRLPLLSTLNSSSICRSRAKISSSTFALPPTRRTEHAVPRTKSDREFSGGKPGPQAERKMMLHAVRIGERSFRTRELMLLPSIRTPCPQSFRLHVPGKPASWAAG